MLLLIIVAFMYLLLEDQITVFLNKPTFTKEQLVELGKKGTLQSRQERSENWDLIENGIHV